MYVCMYVHVRRYDLWHYFQRNGRNISIPLVGMNITVGKEVPCANINSEKPFDQWFLSRYVTSYTCELQSQYVHF